MWQNDKGSTILKARFSKEKELVVSIFQMVVLLLFNESDSLSFAEIQKATGIGRLFLALETAPYHIIRVW